MLLIIALTVLAAGGAGILVKLLLDLNEAEYRISWREFSVGMACTPVLVVLVSWIGWNIARSNNMTFSEYWNGWEVMAVKSSTQCSRDGPCRWEYDCDPYIVMVSYSCNCDSKGNCSTCYRPETRYHSCPYVDNEYHYTVKTTLGDYKIAGSVFPLNPQSHRWRSSHVIPDRVMKNAGIGDPPFWVAAKKRCDENSPGPVTKKSKYPNYILASEHTIMKQYSGDIEEYKKRNLLPDLPKDIYSFYNADKVRFVGFNPANASVWQKSLEYLNGALGSQMQGDLMMVLINSPVISTNPERYSMALKAFWQDKNVNGINALPKNTVVILIGTDDGQTISWSRGFTAMPMGNEKLTTVLRDGLKGLPLNPERIIGPTKSAHYEQKIKYPPDPALTVVPRLLWGLDDPSTKFTRIRMGGDDGKGGFLYLKGEIQPTTRQVWVIAIISFLFCMVVWMLAARHYDPSENEDTIRTMRFWEKILKTKNKKGGRQ